jgi:hypothetical protein
MNASPTCSMETQNGFAAAGWKCSIEMYCSMEILHEHEASTWSIDVKYGHAAWTCSKTCSKKDSMEAA